MEYGWKRYEWAGIGEVTEAEFARLMREQGTPVLGVGPVRGKPKEIHAVDEYVIEVESE